jgi:hypothetical protein
MHAHVHACLQVSPCTFMRVHLCQAASTPAGCGTYVTVRCISACGVGRRLGCSGDLWRAFLGGQSYAHCIGGQAVAAHSSSSLTSTHLIPSHSPWRISGQGMAYPPLYPNYCPDSPPEEKGRQTTSILVLYPCPTCRTHCSLLSPPKPTRHVSPWGPKNALRLGESTAYQYGVGPYAGAGLCCSCCEIDTYLGR